MNLIAEADTEKCFKSFEKIRRRRSEKKQKIFPLQMNRICKLNDLVALAM